MAFTGVLGSDNSRLGNIVLGSLGIEDGGIRQYGQAQAYIIGKPYQHAQAQAKISPGLGSGFGQARAFIDSPIKSAFGQAQAEMGIYATLLDTFTGVSTSITGNTIVPLDNALIIVAIQTHANTDLPTTVSGCGLTFELVTSTTWFNGRLSVWRAQGDALSGEITVTYSGSRQAFVHVIEFKGSTDILTVGDNGIHAVVQSNVNTANGNSCPVSLNTFANIHNVAFGFHAASGGHPISLDSGGYIELAETGLGQTEWLSAEDTSVDASVGGLARLWGGVALEIGKPQPKAYGQALALMNQGFGLGQAQARIGNEYYQHAQANAYIFRIEIKHAQAQGYVGHFKHAQAQARIGLKPIHLTTFSGTGTSISSGTITPQSDALILVGVLTGAGVEPTGVSGCGLTFERIDGTNYYTNNLNITAWRAKGNATSGTITVTYASSRSAVVHVSQWIGAITSGTNGSGAIIQSGTNIENSGTGVTVTLASFASTNNAVYGVFSGTDGNLNVDTSPSGYQQLEHTTSITFFLTMYRLGEDTAVAAGKFAPPTSFYGGIAVEIGEFVSSRQTWHGQAQAEIVSTVKAVHGQAQAKIIAFNVCAYGQAQGSVKQTYYQHGQSQANVLQTYYQHGQAQGNIGNRYEQVAQAQGTIKQTYYVHGQAQADVLQTYQEYAQAQGAILTTYYQHAQAMAHIFGKMAYAQAQGYVDIPIRHGQAQADIKQTYYVHAQAQAVLAVRSWHFAQSAAHIEWYPTKVAQAQAYILGVFRNAYAQAQALMNQAKRFAQAQGYITNRIVDTFTRTVGFGSLGTPDIGPTYTGSMDDASVDGDEGLLLGITDFDSVTADSAVQMPNADMQIDFKYSLLNNEMYMELRTRRGTNFGVYGYLYKFADIFYIGVADQIGAFEFTEVEIAALTVDTYYTLRFRALDTTLYAKVWQTSTAEPGTWMVTRTGVSTATGGVRFYFDVGDLTSATNVNFDNYFVTSNIPREASGQAMAFLDSPVKQQFGQAQGFITKFAGYGQAQARISFATARGHGQCQALINLRLGTSQAQAEIARIVAAHAQTQALVLYPSLQNVAQALAVIRLLHFKSYGQAQAMIKQGNYYAHGQAQAMLGKFARAQAQARIISFGAPNIGQAQAYIKDAGYLVQYGGIDLPGYAQEESYDSIMTISTHQAPYVDTSLGEYLGLKNKIINLRMRVWEQDYATAKREVQKAATILRSKKDYERLYIQTYDKYYLALTKSITSSKTVGEPMRILDYNVEFETKPWLISNTTYTISGTGVINTDVVQRNLYNGGWTPTRILVTGTNITISGYTATGDATGFCSVSGAVVELRIDAEQYQSTLNGNNANNLMNNKDYQIYVGPGKTFFSITGATSCEISWEDRWYL